MNDNKLSMGNIISYSYAKQDNDDIVLAEGVYKIGTFSIKRKTKKSIIKVFVDIDFYALGINDDFKITGIFIAKEGSEESNISIIVSDDLFFLKNMQVNYMDDNLSNMSTVSDESYNIWILIDGMPEFSIRVNEISLAEIAEMTKQELEFEKIDI